MCVYVCVCVCVLFLIRTFSFESQNIVYIDMTYLFSNSLNSSVKDISAAFTKSEHSEKDKSMCIWNKTN